MSSDPAAPVAGTDVVERAPRRSDELPPGSTAYWEALTGEMQSDITALRARVAELADRWLFIAQHPSDEPLSDYHRGFWQAEINTYTQCADEMHELVAAPTPDPRDARIVELEAALRELEALSEKILLDDANVAGLMSAADVHAISEEALGDAHG